jgi:hypothetical protein
MQADVSSASFLSALFERAYLSWLLMLTAASKHSLMTSLNLFQGLQTACKMHGVGFRVAFEHTLQKCGSWVSMLCAGQGSAARAIHY